MYRKLSLASLLATSLLLPLVACDSGDGDGGGGDEVDAAGNTGNDGGNNIDGAVEVAPDAAIGPDAMPSDATLTCVGDPLPTTVTSPPIVISGVVQEAKTSGIAVLTATTHVSAHTFSNDAILGEDNFNGAFTLTDSSASTTPLDAYLKATSSGFLETYVFPATPLSESLDNTPVIMLSNSLFGLIGLLTGITPQTGLGTLSAAIVDCDGASATGATVTITPNVGTIKYAGDNGIPGQSDFSATQEAGVVYFFNVPPGEYTISAKINGIDLRDNLVKSFGDSLTTLIVAP